MKKLARFVLSLTVMTMSVRAYALPDSPLQAAVGRTAPELSVPFNNAMRNTTLPVPEPGTPFRISVKTPQPEYLPPATRAVYEYDYTSSEFPGTKLIRIEYRNYSENDTAVSVTMSDKNRLDDNKAGAYAVYANAAGVYASASPLGGKRLEFPLPAAVGKTWTEGPDTHRITTLTGKISVPAGSYAGCLMVLARLGGGDAGISERFYAPGVGLIYESVSAEDVQETIKLVSYQPK